MKAPNRTGTDYERWSRCDFAVVMIHGFGAESSYYSEQLDAVAAAGGAAYAIDLLGQGRSWPSEDPSPVAGETEAWGWGERLSSNFAEDGVAFGEPTWIAQIADFLSIIPEERVYLLGNSVGGYIATKIVAQSVSSSKSTGLISNTATQKQSKISGLILANATPFWGWFSEGWNPWDGRLPVPGWVRPIATLWFNSLRGGVEKMLGTVYAKPEDPEVRSRLSDLAGRITTAASHPMGSAAFASILFAPKQSPTVGDALDAIDTAGLPVLLVYGEDDPWIVPWWAQRAARRVEHVGEYYSLSPAGHCPHHEAPQAFNFVLIDWLKRREKDQHQEAALPLGGRLEGHGSADETFRFSTTIERRL